MATTSHARGAFAIGSAAVRRSAFGPRVGFLALLVLAGVGGCLFEESDVPTRTPPLLLRQSVPADSTEFTGPISEPLTVVLTFNRVTSVEEVPTLFLVPAPLSEGPFEAFGSGRSLRWVDLVRQPARAYQLLLDGPQMPAPRLLVFYPGEKAGAGAMSGTVRGQGVPGDVLQTVVFALRVTGASFDRADSLAGLPIEDLSLAGPAPQGGTTRYRFTQLWIGAPYLVVGILDTSGDGVYSIEDDWWGYPWDSRSAQPRFVDAASVFEESTDVDFDLLPPESVPPLDFRGVDVQSFRWLPRRTGSGTGATNEG